MSAEKKKHDFHLVDPSPWPIYVSFATLVLAVGADSDAKKVKDSVTSEYF